MKAIKFLNITIAATMIYAIWNTAAIVPDKVLGTIFFGLIIGFWLVSGKRIPGH